MADELRLSLDQARRLAVRSQLLMLWSRLGGFDRAGLDTLLWRERGLFGYWAHSASIVLTEDYPIHRLTMRNHRVTAESGVLQAWLAARAGCSSWRGWTPSPGRCRIPRCRRRSSRWRCSQGRAP